MISAGGGSLAGRISRLSVIFSPSSKRSFRSADIDAGGTLPSPAIRRH